ncbi:MAG: hypothetical protein AAFV43_07295 [Planctomycetota bacterium]
MVIVFVVTAIAAVIIGAIVHYNKKEGERTEMLRRLAERLGLRFTPKHHTLPGRVSDMADFARGHSRYAYNTLHGPLRVGSVTLDVQAGDYHFAVTRSNGKSSSTQHYNLSYLAVRVGLPGTPRVTLRREGFFDTVSAAFGFNDIDFESAEFSRKFHVSSSDKRFAYDLLHPRAIELLLDECPNRLDLRGEWLCLTNKDKRWEVDEFAGWLVWLERFVNLWPDHMDDLPEVSSPATATGAATWKD